MPGGKRSRKQAGGDEQEEDAAAAAAPEKKPKAQQDAAAAEGAEPAAVESEDSEPDEEGEASDDDEEEIVEDAEDDEDEEEEDGEGAEASQPHIWRPGIDKIEQGEQLDVEPGTYDMLHKAQVEWPCLSFDIVRDDLGAQRSTYPMTTYIVAGTQAQRAEDNRIFMMKWSKLYKTSKDGREDEDDAEDSGSDDDEEEHEAVLESKGVPHPGAVNRIRAMPQAGHVVATWADSGKVHMWNLEAHRKALDNPRGKALPNPKPIFTSAAHKKEGFALDFNPHTIGRFLSGANDAQIFLWEPVPGGWNVQSDDPFLGHSGSVEDVQWKRHGTGCETVFASCSADQSVRVWDTREQNRKKAAVTISEAHGSDVNVLSWSPLVGELLVTGADDGGFKIWDTRNTAAGPMANFQWHEKPITSVDWHPTDETVLAVSADDDCLSLWDMAVEDDSAGCEQPPGADHFPPQLLFLHQGQKEPKELHWHPQIPSICISTGGSGFDIFKTCNI